MTKIDECLKALQCLYLEVDATIADDVKRRVLEALDEANKNFVQPDVSGRSELLFAFRDYWKKSKHQTINDAIKGFMKTKKGKQ